MAFRSVDMNLFNMTNHPLKLAATNLSHGIFVAPFAPQIVTPDGWAEWRSESGGDIPIIGSIATGVQGTLDYTIEDAEANIHFEWVNPASGKLIINFPPPTLNPTGGGVSDFVFFATVIVLDGSVEGFPVKAQTTTNDLDDDHDTVLPFPTENNLPNAWFSIGVRNKRDPVSLRRWFKSQRWDPTKGLAAFLGHRPLSLRQMLELPL
jgi:Aegerolysin